MKNIFLIASIWKAYLKVCLPKDYDIILPYLPKLYISLGEVIKNVLFATMSGDLRLHER